LNSTEPDELVVVVVAVVVVVGFVTVSVYEDAGVL
jgi:hypothetical protein